MQVILSVNFTYLLNTSFQIINPLVLPVEGDVFDCEWKDFIEDTSIVQTLEDNADCIWIVNVISKHYYKDKVIITITLVESSNYKQR
jgi:hypothetical protein